jgi:hypothetical protein
VKAERCQATTKNGKPCSATVVADGMCAWHAPSWAERRREWSAEGGRRRSNRARAAKELPAAALTSDQLLIRLSQVIDKAEKGEIEPGVVNCISGAARTITEIRKSTEIERRLEELEQRAGLMNDRRFG